MCDIDIKNTEIKNEEIFMKWFNLYYNNLKQLSKNRGINLPPKKSIKADSLFMDCAFVTNEEYKRKYKNSPPQDYFRILSKYNNIKVT